MRRVLALAASLTLGASPAFADWREYETAHFLIISESQAADVEKFAAQLESYDKLMRMATGIKEDKPVKVRVYEVASTAEVEAALGVSDTGIAGFYTSNQLGPYAVTPRKVQAGRYFTADVVLHHEYAHHFMLQYFPASYPGWYIEGFAELIGSSRMLDDGQIGYGMPAKQRGNEIAANWVSLQELLTKEEVKNVDRYAQGWALTHFFTFDKSRAGQLRQYLTALSRGKSYADAAKMFGDLDQLNREARRYVTSGSFVYKAVKIDIARPAVTKTRLLGPGESALIPETLALSDYDISGLKKASERAHEESARKRNLERIEDKVARYPNEAFPQVLLAEAEYTAGNYDRARAAVTRALSANPNEMRAMARQSILMSHDAAKLNGPARTDAIAKARALAAKSNRAAPDEALPLVAYYQSYNLVGEKPPALAIEGLFQAVSEQPRDDNLRLLLVDRLEKDGRYDEAIAWLTSIAKSPHESPQRAAAQEQMARIIAKRESKKAS